jgi:hypothetical protein
MGREGFYGLRTLLKGCKIDNWCLEMKMRFVRNKGQKYKISTKFDRHVKFLETEQQSPESSIISSPEKVLSLLAKLKKKLETLPVISKGSSNFKSIHPSTKLSTVFTSCFLVFQFHRHKLCITTHRQTSKKKSFHAALQNLTPFKFIVASSFPWHPTAVKLL